MNYIYDVLLNFNKVLYDFYEWNKEDLIIHIRKTPFFKVSEKTMLDIINNKIKVNSDLLYKLYNKTEIISKSKIELLKYVSIISDDKMALALKFNNEGKVISYSKFLLEEEEEIIEYSKDLEYMSFDYEILNKNIYEFKTKREVNIKKYLMKQIENLLKEQKHEKIKYIYLECFNERKDTQYIIKNIYSDLDKNWETVYIKLYNLFKFTMIK